MAGQKETTGGRIRWGLIFVSLCLVGISMMIGCRRKEQVETKQAKETEKPKATTKVVLRSTLAEQGWYPKDAKTLNAQIANMFEKAEAEPLENVVALILPHAGYAYSGQTAVCGLKAINKNYKRVVVIGPSHRLAMQEMLSVPRVTHYETPLGEIPLDVEFIEQLLKHPVFQNQPLAHKHEHSVQIELPLLQYKLGEFKLVPIVAGFCSIETIEKASAILKSLVDEHTLVVASSDFVHYGPNYGYVPFKENIPANLKQLDMGAFERIAALDYKGFLEYKQKTGATICGAVPIAVLLSMMETGTEPKLVKYTTSGELTGDYHNSVSYLSVAFCGSWPKAGAQQSEPNEQQLSQEDRQELLALARKSMLFYLRNQRVPQPSDLGVPISEAMAAPRAAFVTLKKRIAVPGLDNPKGQEIYRLRGCIGDIFPRQPLNKSVIINAINAAVNDRRFMPVTTPECNDIVIEISALTPPAPVKSADEIRIGTDGVVLQKSGRSAVFLPQVAPEQGWDLEQTLTHLSVKAGLPRNAWREGASFLVFQAEVFGEHE